jgi:hypothetical protein
VGESVLPNGSGPTAMAELGSELFVIDNETDGRYEGFLDACIIADGSVSCSLAATLPKYFPEGIGVL